jgi:hypothetical protein
MSVSSTVVPVGAVTAVRLSPNSTDRLAGASVAVYNSSTTITVRLGGSDVTTSTGFPLAPGEKLTIDLAGDRTPSSGGAPTNVDEALWAIAESGTVNVNVLAAGV